jgi:hypothetical protein
MTSGTGATVPRDATSTLEPPAAPELRVANEHIDDKTMLDRLFADEGYLFFRDVFDVESVAVVRRAMTATLERLGLVVPGSDLPISNGTGVGPGAGQTVAPALDEEYSRQGLWQAFVDVPQNREFFEKVVGGAVGFAPISEYRSRPPGSAETYWHQDGYYMQGFGLRTAWVPVMDIDADLGGIEIAAGLHTGTYLHDRETASILPIPEDRIPEELCRRAEYHPGDVLIFGEFMPHTGLPNRTRQELYRLSFDVRFYRADERGYFMGTLERVEGNVIAMLCDDGQERRFRVPDDVIVRATSGETMFGADLASWGMSPGESIMVSSDGDDARYIRPVKFRFATSSES